jgi:hypothetical protein
MVQSDVSPGAFTHFTEILDGAEPHFPQETVDDLILLAQKFGHNGLIASLVPQRDVPRHEENACGLLQELNMDFRNTTIGADLQSIRDSLGVMQRRISVMGEEFGEKLERIMSEVEKITLRSNSRTVQQCSAVVNRWRSHVEIGSRTSQRRVPDL